MHKLCMVKGGKLTPGGKAYSTTDKVRQDFPRKTDPSVGFPWGNPTLGPDFRGKFYPGVDFPGEKISGGESYTTIPVPVNDHHVKVLRPSGPNYWKNVEWILYVFCKKYCSECKTN